MLKSILFLYALVFIGQKDHTPSDIAAEPAIALPELPVEAPRLDPITKNIVHAEKNLPKAPKYQADKEAQTLYFDADSNPNDAAVAGGYYRKIFGKTDDGRLVVQDFYQDNDQPQTGLSVLVKDADPSDFSFDLVDSKTAWYRADGSVQFITDVKGGKAQSYNYYYIDGKLAAIFDLSGEAGIPRTALANWGEIESAFFYPDGRYMAAYLENAEQEVLSIHFRADGSPVLALYMRHFDPINPTENSYRAWQADGSPAHLADALLEVDKIEKAIDPIWKKYQEEL